MKIEFLKDLAIRAKLHGNKQVLFIENIIDSISKLVSKDNSDDDSGKKVSFKDMQKMILNIIEEIDNNLEEEKDEKEKEEKNKILNEELYSFNLESRFLSTVSQLVDAKIISLLAIAIKYCATINLSKTNLEKSLEYLKFASDKGHIKTQEYLGNLYKNGSIKSLEILTKKCIKENDTEKIYLLIHYNILF